MGEMVGHRIIFQYRAKSHYGKVDGGAPPICQLLRGWLG